LVIFDSDGTLIDSRASHRSFYRKLKSELGLGPLVIEEEYCFFSTQGQIIEWIIPEELWPKARELAPGLRLRYFDPLVRFPPGLMPFLDQLRQRDIHLVVNTNAGREALRIYKRLGLDYYLRAVFTADDVAKPKPDPEGVDLILSGLGLPRRRRFSSVIP
jgi:phosphoglycolate phosphatase